MATFAYYAITDCLQMHHHSFIFRLSCCCFIAALFIAHAAAQQAQTIDAAATKETRALFSNLYRVLQKGIMFGHQDDLAYGVNWQYEPGRSDIKDVTGDFPAVYGWELGHLETGSLTNLDGVPFEKMKAFIREGYDRGGVITVSWHMNNPLTGKSAWDPAPGTVASILPGGEKHAVYTSWLDTLAGFFHSLKGSEGEPIPVIFRPFHELNGSWFWWGKDHCSPDELKQLYRFTVHYLRDTKNIHNLLYAFNTDRFNSKAVYMERFPGVAYVDIIGFDVYQRDADNAGFIADMNGYLGLLTGIATELNKLPAITEFGYSMLPDAAWWTTALLKAVQPYRISFMLAWRNAGKKTDGSEEFYVPFTGQASAADFIRFYNDPVTLFQKDITAEKMYR